MTLPTTGIIGHWSPSQQNDSASTLTDYSVESNNGTLVNGASWIADTTNGGQAAIVHDGSASDHRVDLVDLSTIMANTDPYSVAIWVRFTAITADMRTTSSAVFASPHLTFTPSVNSDGLTGLTHFSASVGWQNVFPVTLVTGQWYHVGMTYQKISTTWRAKAYLDGVPGSEFNCGTLNPAWSSAGMLRVAGRYANSFGNRLNGRWDDLLIFDHVLSDANFATLAGGRNLYAPTGNTAAELRYGNRLYHRGVMPIGSGTEAMQRGHRMAQRGVYL